VGGGAEDGGTLDLGPQMRFESASLIGEAAQRGPVGNRV
jgi:hypothetical protein